jgi:hypothetical protein
VRVLAIRIPDAGAFLSSSWIAGAGPPNFLLRDIENGVNLPKKFTYRRTICEKHQF